MTTTEPLPALTWKLWIYTNYDCNLSCSYCVAESTPRAPRNAIGLDITRRIVDEACDLYTKESCGTAGWGAGAYGIHLRVESGSPCEILY